MSSVACSHLSTLTCWCTGVKTRTSKPVVVVVPVVYSGSTCNSGSTCSIPVVPVLVIVPVAARSRDGHAARSIPAVDLAVHEGHVHSGSTCSSHSTCSSSIVVIVPVSTCGTCSSSSTCSSGGTCTKRTCASPRRAVSES